MRLYLINPRNSLVTLSNVNNNRWNRYRIWKPLGLLVLASVTPPQWDIKVIDENLGKANYASMPPPDLVGITAFTAQASRAYEVATEFRSRSVEADFIWPKNLADFQNGSLKQVYAGEHVDMKNVPPARHDLLPHRYTFGSIQTTRGCPLNCSFCSVTAFNGPDYRARPIENVVREFKTIPEKLILVVDDNLIGTSEEHIGRAKSLFRAIIATGIRKKWCAQTTINIADDDELLTLAYKAGCRGVYIGFESPTADGLAEVGKKFNLAKSRDIRDSVHRIKQHKILVVGSFIIGLDTDRLGVGKLIAEMANSYGVDLLNIAVLTPLPGTRLWKKMESEGRIAVNSFPNDWKYYTLTFPVARYKQLSWNDIIKEKRYCDKAFYSTKRILSRLRGNFWQRRSPIIAMVANLSYKNNLCLVRKAYQQFELSHGQARQGTWQLRACLPAKS